MAMHMFDPQIAKEYGVNAAIIFQNLAYWIEHNRANETNFHDGRYWTYNSVRAFSVLFPYLTDKQIRGALKKLEDGGMILVGNYNKSAYDRTRWYALAEKGLSIYTKGQMDSADRENENAPEGEPIPDINTNETTLCKPDISASKKETRHKYGEYSNVLLTDSDMKKLKEEFPTDWGERVERLSAYMASTGKSYKNHLATIRNWARRGRDANRGTVSRETSSGFDKKVDADYYYQSTGDEEVDKVLGLGKYAPNANK
jgi:hypothetical protein